MKKLSIIGSLLVCIFVNNAYALLQFGCQYVAKTEYTCSVGYFGEPASDDDECARCPDAATTYTDSDKTTRAVGTTSGDGATANTDCHLVGGNTTLYYNDNGEFVINGETCDYALGANSSSIR